LTTVLRKQFGGPWDSHALATLWPLFAGALTHPRRAPRAAFVQLWQETFGKCARLEMPDEFRWVGSESAANLFFRIVFVDVRDKLHLAIAPTATTAMPLGDQQMNAAAGDSVANVDSIDFRRLSQVRLYRVYGHFVLIYTFQL
jgi:hypothetical protein